MKQVHVENQGQLIDLPLGETIVGRSPRCGLRFNDPSVSRMHMRFLRRSEELFVEDLGSVNGIEVNGRRVRGFIELLDGDTISFGRLAIAVRMDPTEEFDTPTLLQRRIALEAETATKRDALSVEHDRRRHARHEVRMEIVYVSHELEIEGHSVDLSESGIFVSSPVLEPIGTSCVLMLKGVATGPIKVQGIVRRVVERDDADTGLGVEFVGLGGGERALIQKLVGQAAHSVH